ncbi:Hypothetical predicted protein [Podarcis lilfordi]|uniref:Uncharacterized protein n=1 Tax=Podarcis lilfordi TaxID=74358 RepID=A0AA35JP66_9SAUR|nr:Hypothetical predicted protein [Podarcis lilfordi]
MVRGSETLALALKGRGAEFPAGLGGESALFFLACCEAVLQRGSKSRDKYRGKGRRELKLLESSCLQ